MSSQQNPITHFLPENKELGKRETVLIFVNDRDVGFVYCLLESDMTKSGATGVWNYRGRVICDWVRQFVI